MSRYLMSLVCLASAGLAAPSWANDQVASDGGLFPPNAKPGECYARVFVPPVYETRSETVLKRAASERVEVTPAKFEQVTERVLVQEEAERIIPVAATYEWTEERVMTKPASTKLVEVPARFEQVSEQVLDRPAHTVWKKGTGPIQRVDNGTGEIMCLVEVPATYKTVTRTEMVAPATTKEVTIPAEYRTVRKKVVKTPATFRKETIPAKYETVTVRKMVAPPSERRFDIPAQHQTVTKRELIRDGYLSWQQVLCETNLSGQKVTDIQRALSAAGYSPGPIDGRVGSETLAAVDAFQRAKGLATGGLTMETLKALGL